MLKDTYEATITIAMIQVEVPSKSAISVPVPLCKIQELERLRCALLIEMRINGLDLIVLPRDGKPDITVGVRLHLTKRVTSEILSNES